MAGDIHVNLEKDSLGLAKPAKSLINLFGRTFDDIFKTDGKRIIRVAKAEAEAEQIRIMKAEETKTIVLKEQITRRILLQEYIKQTNFNNVMALANNELGEISLDPKDSLEPDWAMRFIDTAGNTSDEEIQRILAKILISEAQSATKSNKRLLNFLKSTNKSELEEFKKVVKISSDIGVYKLSTSPSSNLSKYGLSTNTIRELSDVGLMSFANNLSVKKDISSNDSCILSFYDYYIIAASSSKKHLELGIIPFTTTGKQLATVLRPFIKPDKHSQYIKDFISYLESLSLEVSIVKKPPHH